jgi:hypothetical protein
MVEVLELLRDMSDLLDALFVLLAISFGVGIGISLSGSLQLGFYLWAAIIITGGIIPLMLTKLGYIDN